MIIPVACIPFNPCLRRYSEVPAQRGAVCGDSPDVPALHHGRRSRGGVRGREEAVQDLGEVQAQQTVQPDRAGDRVQVRLCFCFVFYCW